jgi:hypothetical protein
MRISNFFFALFLWGLLINLAMVGCDNDKSESELVPYAEAANEYIGDTFGARLSTLDGITLCWGEESSWRDTGNEHGWIVIDQTLQDDPAAIQCHMTHEVFHAVTGMSESDGEEYNGVRIGDYIVWQHSEELK